MKTVVALYDRLEDARNAVNGLVNAGFMRDDISLVAGDVTGEYRTHLGGHDGDDVADAAATGAVGGAVVGGLAGLLVGLGALAIPGVGPIIAAGPLAATLAGAGIGAAAGGLLGALVEWGIPEAEAGYYSEAVRRGGTLVAVRSDEGDVNRITQILENYNPIDIERRAEYWRSEYGWEGYDPDAEPYTAADFDRDRTNLGAYDWDADVDVDLPAWADLETGFRRDFDTRFAGTGYTWADYTPAYRFGYNLANDARYRNRSWAEVERDARMGWEERNEGAWDDFKDAVQYSREQVKDALGVGPYQAGVEDSEDEWAHRRR